MNIRTWLKCTTAVAVLWGTTCWSATLTWSPNSEPDLAGYRVYRCNQLPCGKNSGTATLLTTLGKVTSYNIGTPSVVQHYIVTAFDTANNESAESGVATYTPVVSTPPPPPSSPPPPPAEDPPPAPPAPPPVPTGLRLLTMN